MNVIILLQHLGMLAGFGAWLQQLVGLPHKNELPGTSVKLKY